MKILSLNCQRGMQSSLKDFLSQKFDTEKYDFFLLQEADKKVLDFLNHPLYKLLSVFDSDAKQKSELCIVYKTKYNLIQHGFKSFASMRKDPLLGFKSPSFGLLWADFEIADKITRVATIHLHSGIDSRARLKELRLAQKILLDESPVPHVILAGDLNAGFPGEQKQMARVLAPEFAWTTKDIGPTLDSRYSENVAHLPNRLAALLRLFNTGVQLRTDHFFVNQQTIQGNNIESSKLPDRVSDHSPVEFIIDTAIAKI